MTTKTIQHGFFFIAFALIFILSFFIVKPYVTALVLAGTFAIIFYPLYRWFIKSFHDRFHSLAAILTVVIAGLLVFVPMVYLGTRVFTEASNVYQTLSERTNTEQAPLGDDFFLSDNPTIVELQARFEGALTRTIANFNTSLQSGFEWALANAGGFFEGLAHFGVSVFIWLLAFYYFLRDGTRIKDTFVVMSPLSDRYDQEIAKRIVTSVKSVIGGSIIVAILQGILAGVGFAILGVPAPALWGFVAILAALVPTVGTALVMLPAAGYLLLTGSFVQALILIAWGVFIVGSIDNALRPFLIERGIRIHPLIILLSVLGGISLWGPVGFLLGPIVFSLLYEFVTIYQEMIVEQKV